MLNASANVVAGLGLFFVGVWFLTENMKSLAGRRFRQAVVRWTKNSFVGFGLGGMLGAVAQSMAVTIFILVSLITAGLVSVRTAMPIIIGANFGTSTLVFLTTVDIKLVMLFVIGVSGIAVVSERFANLRHYVGALFGLGLLFLGISMIQGGAISLVEQPWAAKLLEDVRHSYLFTFFAGALLAFVAQSGAAASILVIALAGVGVFGLEQTVMAIYGAVAGTGFVALTLSWKLRGRQRQLALYQILFMNWLASVMLVALFYLEIFGGVPLVISLVGILADDVERQMAWVYLLLNVPGLVFLLFSSPIATAMERFWPPTQAEDDAKPQYIHDRAISDPESALDLIELEQQRMIGFFTRYFDALRKHRGGHDVAGTLAKPLHDSFVTLSNLVAELLEDLGRTKSVDTIYERLNLSMNNQRLIQTIESTLYDLANTIADVKHSSPIRELADTTIEALDTVLLTLDSVLVEGDEFDKKLLRNMTGDRSSVLQSVRKSYLSSDVVLDGDDKLQLLKVTNLCERFFWLLGDLRLESGEPIRSMEG